jgi:cystathionine beta-lyase/cystathionine gamma-synthase
MAMYLKNHPKVEKVIYPLLEEDAGFEIMKKQSSGFSAMIAFYLKSEDFDEICDFAKDLKL